MTRALFHVGLKRMVGRDARRRVRLRFRGVADVRNAEVDISAFEGLLIGLAAVREAADGEGRGVEGVLLSDERVAVGVILLKLRTLEDGAGWRGNPRLVERQGNDFMAAEIADVSDLESEVATRLPLDIERMIDRVGEFVGSVVIGEG